MAARREWTEWHLTPRGWQRGSTRSQGKNNWIDDPEDRVLSFVTREEETSTSGLTHTTEETWRSKTADTIDDLLQQFGKCPSIL
ncbi:MAG TPA: hypothetical protein VM554_03125 [Acidisarcina sp.]|nr:hypothetical protein [Acidisarcina sp.]